MYDVCILLLLFDLFFQWKMIIKDKEDKPTLQKYEIQIMRTYQAGLT